MEYYYTTQKALPRILYDKIIGLHSMIDNGEFAFRFISSSMPHKGEIVSLTEQVLKPKGIERDSKISELSEEQLKEILEQVRKLRKKEECWRQK